MGVVVRGWRTMKALGSLLLAGVYAGASATSIHSTLTHSEYGLINWQRVGACGVPAKRPHSDIFDMLATRTTSGQNPKRKRTGNQNGNGVFRIVGGKEALPNSWPWQVHISVCGRWYGMLECNICGGSIIHPRYVVSAAHCVPETPTGNVIAGAHALSKAKSRIPILKFIQHPSWNRPTQFDHDMSIIVVRFEIEINSDASPICLPHPTTCFSEGTACVVTGWGLTGETGGFPDRLQEVAVRMISQERCSSYVGYHILTDNMMCAGYEDGGKDACAGDSGGPLVCRIPAGAWVLNGVVSWGYGCARPGSPGVYAKVSNMLDFIYDVTEQVPDNNLIVDECHNSGVEDDKQWKKDNNGIYATLTPPWLETPKPTDLSQADDGRLRDTCNYDATSDGYYIITPEHHSEKMEIRSDNWPRPYRPNVQCEYTIQNTNPEKFIQLDVGTIQMDCRGSGDRIVMETSHKTYKFCKSKRPTKITDPSNIQIIYYTDRSRQYRGFKLNYSFKSMFFQCDGPDSLDLRSQPRAQIRSENYPRPYGPSSQCRWHVQSEKGIKIYVKMFRGETGPCDSNNDNLVVFDAPDCNTETLETAKIWGSMCGYIKRKYYLITSQQLCIVFIADGDRRRNRGFDIMLYPQ